MSHLNVDEESSYPKTKEEWWQFVDDNWDNLKYIVLAYYPNQQDFPEKGWPVNNTPQAVCNQIIQELRDKNPIWKNKDFFKAYIDHLRETRDTKLNEIFQASWFGMPESSRVREIPGFFTFCDLCSENHVLYEEGELNET